MAAARSADDRRRISDGGRLGRSLARHRCGLRCRAGATPKLSVQEFLKVAQSGLEPGRARAFQSRREQEGRGRAVRVPRDLHDPAVGAGQGAASAARQGAAGIRRREEPRAPAVAADAGAARRRAMRLAEGDGRCRRDLSSAALDARNRRCSSSRTLPALESAGVVVRMPASWRMNRPARPQVKATVGGKAPSQLGLDALLDFQMEVTLDGETLSAAEIKRLLAQTDGLAFIRGKWVEIDRERLSRTLEQFEAIERRRRRRRPVVRRGDAPAGRSRNCRRRGRRAEADVDWSQTVAGPWLAQTLADLRRPGRARARRSRPHRCTARCGPISRPGVQWLHLLARLGLGACLADDMGLGKTIQVLSLLLVLKKRGGGRAQAVAAGRAGIAARQLGGRDRPLRAEPEGGRGPSLGDAGREARRRPAPAGLAGVDLVITSYGLLARAPWLAEHAVAAGGARRGAGHQESRRQADPGGQAAARPTRASR